MDNTYQNTQQNQSTPGFTKYLIFSILELICCCQITGIISLIFTCLANSSYKSGRFEEYTKQMKTSKISLIIGLVLGIVVTISIIVFYVFLFSTQLNTL